MRTSDPAGVAFGAKFEVDNMPAIRCCRNGTNGARAAAKRTAVAIVVDMVLDKRLTLTRRAAAFQVGFIFVPKITKRRKDRVRGGFAESAQAAGFHLFG